MDGRAHVDDVRRAARELPKVETDVSRAVEL